MQIQNILAGYSDAAAMGKRNDPVEAALQRPLEKLAKPEASGPVSVELLRGILSDYDVTDITPREFSEMLTELRDAGAISDEDFQELSQIRIDLDRDGVDSDDSIDLVAYHTRKLQEAEKAAPGETGGTSAENLGRRLAWLQKLATAQSSPDEVGLDLAA